MAMKVSVAMATYMGSAYLVEQLRSIQEQSTPPAEIIVCDDRSSDRTVQLIRDFARDSPIPIRLFINEERLGWRANFMKAASLCAFELIAFSDQDDIWDRRKLELIAAEFERPDTLMVFHDATIVRSDLEPIGPFVQGAGEPDRAGALERSPWCDVYGFTIAFRSELLALWTYWPSSADKSVGHQRAPHDQWLLFLGASLGTTSHLPTSLTLYRQHDRNVVGAKDALRRSSRMDLFLQFRDVIDLRLVVLDSRIRVLSEIARHPGEFRESAAAASRVYVAYRRRIVMQATIYTSSAVTERVRALAGLLARVAYSSDPWALGSSSVLEDGVAALVGPTGLAWLRRARSRRAIARTRA